ncbi:MAG: phenylalanine--tRNA ligase beta subunit-related protein [Candidatus Nezhaarchaeales archaeon]
MYTAYSDSSKTKREVRRVLTGKPFPQVNNVVDAYNLASLETGVAIAAFDLEGVKGGLTLRLQAYLYHRFNV